MLRTATEPLRVAASVEHSPVGGDWDMWRDFAVRSAGFPVDGLDVFGAGDETARLTAIAQDPGFREAMSWQNPMAVVNALDRVAQGSGTGNAKARRRQELVAGYWQRYCSKNDTIGFYGPLAWGRIADAPAPALHARSGALIRERSVHLESWSVQKLAATIDAELRVPYGPRSEDDLRRLLDAHPDPAVRARGRVALSALVDARDALARAGRAELPAALAALDATFVRLTGTQPTRNPGRAYGARTLAYLDCMRDLDVTVGRTLLDDIAPALITLFEAGRWYCGRVHRIGVGIVESAVPARGRVPFLSVLPRVMESLMAPPAEIADVLADLQRRMSVLLGDPEPSTLAARARLAFADRVPAWRFSGHQSVDLQIAARDEQAIRDGDYLAVIGDSHPGANPLYQGVFAHRHPAPARFRELQRRESGAALPFLLPPWGSEMNAEARGVPVLGDDAIHIAMSPESAAPNGRRTWRPHELWVQSTGDLVDASGALRMPLAEVFSTPIFVAGVRSWVPMGGGEHSPRLVVGKAVLRRESWSLPGSCVPGDADHLADWARDGGMPRRVFVKTPVERKPFYLDFDSPVLRRIAARHIRQSATAQEPVRFTEMLPSPEDCWLADPEGRRYTSELRLVAFDSTHNPSRGSR
jgi:hypothetical protein